ncbi:MAG: hypothetical protein LBM99_00565, partial [Bacillales bacterium]|nr:hypothetical protein [Bacillales bacterium]
HSKDGNKIERQIKRLIKDTNKQNIIIDYDFILKSCLFLLEDQQIQIKINNIKSELLDNINKHWEDIAKALRAMSNCVSNLGFSKNNITSDNALIPIAYMYYKKKKADDEIVKEYLFRAFLKRVFGGASDTTLTQVRTLMKSKGGEIKILLSDEKFQINKEFDIPRILKYPKSKYTFLSLMILYDKDFDYGNLPDLEQDHMHPKSFFGNIEKFKQIIIKEGFQDKNLEEVCHFWNEEYNCNTLSNLRIVKKLRNRGKSDKPLSECKEVKNAMTKNYLAENTSLELGKYREFFETRQERIKAKLKKYFGC